MTAQNEYQLKLRDLTLVEKVKELTDKAEKDAAMEKERLVGWSRGQSWHADPNLTLQLGGPGFGSRHQPAKCVELGLYPLLYFPSFFCAGDHSMKDLQQLIMCCVRFRYHELLIERNRIETQYEEKLTKAEEKYQVCAIHS